MARIPKWKKEELLRSESQRTRNLRRWAKLEADGFVLVQVKVPAGRRQWIKNQAAMICEKDMDH